MGQSAVTALGVAAEPQAHGEGYLDQLMAEYAEAGLVRKRELAALLLSQYPKVFPPPVLERILGRRRDTLYRHAERAKRGLRRLGEAG